MKQVISLFILISFSYYGHSQTYCINSLSYYYASNEKEILKNSPISFCIDLKKQRFEMCSNGVLDDSKDIDITKPDIMKLEDSIKLYTFNNVSYYREWDKDKQSMVNVEPGTYYINMGISNDGVSSFIFGNSVKDYHFLINSSSVKKIITDTLAHCKMKYFPYIEKYKSLRKTTANNKTQISTIQKGKKCDDKKNWYNAGTGNGCYNGNELLLDPKEEYFIIVN